ncbi:hypothetical protein C6502_12615 [Candidatus Poribacteria bacterium]|nr:MAG: hypothetical protein C6502_12615 [Candidatus Poribacteria bacterium]
MTHLNSHFLRIRASHVSCLKLLYIPIFLICIGCAGGSGKEQNTVSIADLRAQLKPLRKIGTYAGFDQKAHVLYMGNDSVERWLRLNQEAHKIQTIHYAHKGSGQNYIDRPSEEFRFRIGEIIFSGDSSLLTYNDYQIAQKIGGSKRVTVQFTHNSVEEAKPTFYLWIHYEISPDLPVIRKWLTIQNLTDSAFFIENVVIESLPLFAGREDSLQVWQYGMSGILEEPLPTPWEGGTSDPFILIGNADINGGVVLGNEGAGILKYYAVYSDREAVSIGLRPTTAINGAEIRVPPSRSVNTPKVWTMLFEGGLQATIEKITQDGLAYIPSYSRDAKLHIPEIQWITLETELERSIGAMRPGDLIALDYDWNIEDLQSIKQISRQVHEGGGKFGIRLPVAEIHTSILDHPEWQFAPVPVFRWPAVPKNHDMDREGEQDEGETQQSTTHEAVPVIYCVLSDYGYYLTQAVKTLLQETETDLLILDRPILGSQHNLLKGCDALGHQHYTRAESIGAIYRWLFQFADYLHREYPALQLGITASTYGVEQPDAACLAHFDLFFDDLSAKSPDSSHKAQ